MVSAAVAVLLLGLATGTVRHHWHHWHHFRYNGSRSFRSPMEDLLPPWEERIAWPVKREAVVEGDVVLGGLMMVHEREDTRTCGPVMPQGGIQAVETMLYTLDKINAMRLPFTIGAHILDDCDKDTYGLEMAVDFIKGRPKFH
nr:metabotropic glutamate receptor 2-like [Halyomorpha halys]